MDQTVKSTTGTNIDGVSNNRGDADSSFKTAGYWIFFVVMTAMFAYAAVAGYGNVTGMADIGSQLDMTFSVVGKIWAGFIIAMPVIIYAIMILLGLGKKKFQKGLLLFLGLAIASAWSLNLTHFVTLTNILEF